MDLLGSAALVDERQEFVPLLERDLDGGDGSDDKGLCAVNKF